MKNMLLKKSRIFIFLYFKLIILGLNDLFINSREVIVIFFKRKKRDLFVKITAFNWIMPPSLVVYKRYIVDDIH